MVTRDFFSSKYGNFCKNKSQKTFVQFTLGLFCHHSVNICLEKTLHYRDYHLDNSYLLHLQPLNNILMFVRCVKNYTHVCVGVCPLQDLFFFNFKIWTNTRINGRLKEIHSNNST
jgi:hypothetical protein